MAARLPGRLLAAGTTASARPPLGRGDDSARPRFLIPESNPQTPVLSRSEGFPVRNEEQ